MRYIDREVDEGYMSVDIMSMLEDAIMYNDGEGIGEFAVSFSIAGDDLAKLMGVQKRTLAKKILDLTPKKAHFLIEKKFNKEGIPATIRKTIRDSILLELSDMGNYSVTINDLQMAESQILNTVVDAKHHKVDFIVLVDVIFDIRES